MLPVVVADDHLGPFYQYAPGVHLEDHAALRGHGWRFELESPMCLVGPKTCAAKADSYIGAGQDEVPRCHPGSVVRCERKSDAPEKPLASANRPGRIKRQGAA